MEVWSPCDEYPFVCYISTNIPGCYAFTNLPNSCLCVKVHAGLDVSATFKIEEGGCP